MVTYYSGDMESVFFGTTTTYFALPSCGDLRIACVLVDDNSWTDTTTTLDIDGVSFALVEKWGMYALKVLIEQETNELNEQHLFTTSTGADGEEIFHLALLNEPKVPIMSTTIQDIPFALNEMGRLILVQETAVMDHYADNTALVNIMGTPTIAKQYYGKWYLPFSVDPLPSSSSSSSSVSSSSSMSRSSSSSSKGSNYSSSSSSAKAEMTFTIGSGKDYETLAAWQTAWKDHPVPTHYILKLGNQVLALNNLSNSFPSGTEITFQADDGWDPEPNIVFGAYMYMESTMFFTNTNDITVNFRNLGILMNSNDMTEMLYFNGEHVSTNIEGCTIHFGIDLGTDYFGNSTSRYKRLIRITKTNVATSHTFKNNIVSINDTTTTTPEGSFYVYGCDASGGTLDFDIRHNTFSINTDSSNAGDCEVLNFSASGTTNGTVNIYNNAFFNYGNNLKVDIDNNVGGSTNITFNMSNNATDGNYNTVNGDVTGLTSSDLEEGYIPAVGGTLWNAGNNTYSASNDFYKTSRPQGSTVDIGAVENTQGSSSSSSSSVSSSSISSSSSAVITGSSKSSSSSSVSSSSSSSVSSSSSSF